MPPTTVLGYSYVRVVDTAFRTISISFIFCLLKFLIFIAFLCFFLFSFKISNFFHQICDDLFICHLLCFSLFLFYLNLIKLRFCFVLCFSSNAVTMPVWTVNFSTTCHNDNQITIFVSLCQISDICLYFKELVKFILLIELI